MDNAGWRTRRAWWPWLVCAVGAKCFGQTDDDAAALALPAAAPAGAAASTIRPVTATFEALAAEAAERGSGAKNLARLSVDARLDESFATDWRAVVAERIDAAWAGSFGSNTEVGTLKEAYVGWQPLADLLIDTGRINARQGVAFGYNPTDFFRADAIRSLVSLDPNSLRDNRLGTVMLRGQDLWDSGSVTAVYAPRLTEQTNNAALNPDWGATNSHNRWLVSLSQRLAPGLTPQWLLFGQDDRSPQFGLDLTATLGSSTVAYVEAAMGRGSSSLAQAIDLPDRSAFRSRAATGLTYTFANKLSLTFEYEYDGAGLGLEAWNRLRSGNYAVYGAYRQYVLLQQDLPTLSNAFVYATWQDLVFRHVDLTAFLREDLIDHSLLPYLELRRHWNSVDVAFRWQTVRGDPTSDYGASMQQQTWQILVDLYL